MLADIAQLPCHFCSESHHQVVCVWQSHITPRKQGRTTNSGTPPGNQLHIK